MKLCSGKLRLIACFILLSSPVAQAAKIDVISLGPNKPSLVTVYGPIELHDNDQFLRKISNLTRAIVAFNSDGGSLLAGIQIGKTIRLKNFASLVPDGMRCASSCALAWLGGTTRLMAPQAQIGFHAASDGETGKVTSAGNALVGAYLNKIGLPYSVVVYVTSAAPEAISWLSKSDAEKLGIEVSFYNAPDEPTGVAPKYSAEPPDQARTASPKRPTSQQQPPCFGSEDCKYHQRRYCLGPEDCKDHPDYLAFDTPTNTASTKRPTFQQQPPCFGSEDCKSHPDYSAFSQPVRRFDAHPEFRASKLRGPHEPVPSINVDCRIVQRHQSPVERPINCRLLFVNQIGSTLSKNAAEPAVPEIAECAARVTSRAAYFAARGFDSAASTFFSVRTFQ